MGAEDIRILFLCRDNAVRSIMAEAILNRHGAGRIRGMSAGSKPAQQVHPEAVKALVASGYEAELLQPKSWDTFAQADAPPAHLVITVCDDVAEDACPAWPGRPARAHWELSNPIVESERHDGDPYAFRAALQNLEERISRFLSRLEKQPNIADRDLERAAALD